MPAVPRAHTLRVGEGHLAGGAAVGEAVAVRVRSQWQVGGVSPKERSKGAARAAAVQGLQRLRDSVTLQPGVALQRQDPPHGGTSPGGGAVQQVGLR